MSTLEIVFVGYLFNISTILLVTVYILSVLMFLSFTNKFEYVKILMDTESKKARINFLKQNIKSYKKYDFSMIFPFMKIIFIYRLINSSIRFGILGGILYEFEYEFQKLEELYRLEKDV